jgi:hypothetical protein
VNGWLQDAAGLDAWPAVIPDRLWAWAIELAAMVMENPTAKWSQTVDDSVYRPAGLTGIATAVPGQAYETWTPQTDPTAGLFAITATTIGTTGPTLATNPTVVVPYNTQSTIDRVHGGAGLRDRHRERLGLRQPRQHAAGLAPDPARHRDRGLIRCPSDEA